MRVRIYNVGFGESFLLHNKNDIMLLDCGSEMKKTAKTPEISRCQAFRSIENDITQHFKEYNCDAMISHFHHDHMNGFKEIFEKHPQMFRRVFIPDIFSMKQHPNVIDAAILEAILRRYPYRKHKKQVIISMWDVLSLLIHNRKDIVLLRRNKKAFQFGDTDVDVLWPEPSLAIPAKRYEKIIKEDHELREFATRIERLSNSISDNVMSYVNPNYISTQRRDNQKDLSWVEDQITGIAKEFAYIFNEDNGFDTKAIDALIDLLRDEANQTSIVCQLNLEGRPVLFTGDIETKTMEWIANNKDGRVPLYKNYYAIKAPHHGTHSDAKPELKHYFNFKANGINTENMIISNGYTRLKNQRGSISALYANDPSYKTICTNTISDRCEFWRINHICKDHCTLCDRAKYTSQSCKGCYHISL